MNIRHATRADAATLSQIAMAAKAEWGYSADDLERWRAELTISEDSIGSLPTYVAEQGTAIAGFYQIDTRKEPPWLDHLWIHPQSMRRGIGRALLSHAAALVKSAGHTSLAIDSDPNAEPFYLACGALRFGSVPASIRDQPDRFRPQLQLAV